MSFAVRFAAQSISLRTDRISPVDAERQERTAADILKRLEKQPGVILADEVGMGKTFVALATAASVALARPDGGPVVVMVPPSLKQKWPKDWEVFRQHCLRGEPASQLLTPGQLLLSETTCQPPTSKLYQRRPAGAARAPQ